MAKSQITFSGKIDEFEGLLKPGAFMKILREEVDRATTRNALLVQDEIKQRILQKKYEPNSKITEILKGENFPLKDTADMIQAIEVEIRDSFTGFVGFLKNQKTSHGGDMKKVVDRLQEGFEVRITPKMRAFLFAKAREAGWEPEEGQEPTGSTGVIRVPPRPFLQEVFDDKKIIGIVNRNWENAVKMTLQRFKAL